MVPAESLPEIFVQVLGQFLFWLFIPNVNELYCPWIRCRVEFLEKIYELLCHLLRLSWPWSPEEEKKKLFEAVWDFVDLHFLSFLDDVSSFSEEHL